MTEVSAMTVGDLRKLIENLPDELEIIQTLYSDYTEVIEKDWDIVKAVYQPSVPYYMRSHPTMSQENKDKEKYYLHFKGN